MFKDEIQSTPLTSTDASECFGNVISDIYWSCGGRTVYDVSFLSTIRALVSPRIPEGDIVNVKSITTGISKRYNYVATPNVGEIRIFNICHSVKSDRELLMKDVKERYELLNRGWHMIPKITAFYHKAFDVMCFINPEIKSVEIFIDDLSLPKLHYLQCSIFAFLPWYFDPQKGVSELEMSLIESLREKTSDKYIECCAKIAETYNLRELRIRKQLSGFESRFDNLEIDKLKHSIEDIDNWINSRMAEIEINLRNRRDSEIKLLGLTTKVKDAEEESEIMNFFLRNKNLMLSSVTDREIRYFCKGYLEYFDSEMARKMINNPRSYFYKRNINGDIQNSDMKMLLEALFIDCTLRIKFCAGYKVVLGSFVEAISHHTYTDDYEFTECFPNPHIDAYACLGNYRQIMAESVIENDYITAISQSIASCKSLNLGDSVVMEEFMRRLCGQVGGINTTCIELPDGTVVKPKEAIKWLKNQKGEVISE